jgi:hypothetical protein
MRGLELCAARGSGTAWTVLAEEPGAEPCEQRRRGLRSEVPTGGRAYRLDRGHRGGHRGAARGHHDHMARSAISSPMDPELDQTCLLTVRSPCAVDQQLEGVSAPAWICRNGTMAWHTGPRGSRDEERAARGSSGVWPRCGTARALDDLAHAASDRSRDASSRLHVNPAAAGPGRFGQGQDDRDRRDHLGSECGAAEHPARRHDAGGHNRGPCTSCVQSGFGFGHAAPFR